MLYASIARKKSVFKGILKMTISFVWPENISYGEDWLQHEVE
jgi:hypothetical protein